MYILRNDGSGNFQALFDCSRDRVRHPRETKGAGYDVATEAAAFTCRPEDGCC